MENKLKEMKEYLLNREGWNLEELIETICCETGLLKYRMLNNKDDDIEIDECRIIWGTLEDNSCEVCDLDEFIKSYTEIFIEKICNVIDSFDDEVVHLSKTEIKELIKEADELAKSDEGEVSFDELFGEDING